MGEETSCRIHGSVEKAAVAEACERGRAETSEKLWGEGEREGRKGKRLISALKRVVLTSHFPTTEGSALRITITASSYFLFPLKTSYPPRRRPCDGFVV